MPCPPLGDLPDPGMEPVSLLSPALAGGFFTASVTWEALIPGGHSAQYSLNAFQFFLLPMKEAIDNTSEVFMSIFVKGKNAAQFFSLCITKDNKTNVKFMLFKTVKPFFYLQAVDR